MGKLGYFVKEEKDIPVQYRDLYVQEEDVGWFLDADGVKDEVEFNKMAIAIAKERKEHKETKEKLLAVSQKANVDPDEDLTASLPLDPKVEKILEAKLKAKLTPLEREKIALQEKIAAQDVRLTEYKQASLERKIEGEIRKARTNLKFLEAFDEDLALRAARYFEEDAEGNLVHKTEQIYLADWIRKTVEGKPHWFAPSQGGGSTGSTGGNNGVVNPWDSKSLNITEQMRITRADPARAAKLKAAAK
jgi:hypothetical protein